MYQKKHMQRFADEALAVAFSRSWINVKDLLDSYVRRLAYTIPYMIGQAQYPVYAGHIASAFGHRLASRISQQDILNFSER